MSPGLILTFVYGGLSCLGGIVGYRQAGSKISLVSGTISGVLLLISGVLILQNSGVGVWLARIVTILLVAVFTVRLLKTKSLMPAGLMVVVGVATAIALFNL